ncbi:MAG: cytochrome c peroxidase [Bacteroidota bacterium]
MKKWIIFGTIASMAYFLACKQTEVTDLDKQLEDAMATASETGYIEHFMMPSGANLDEIPNQDPRNLVTAAKVALGKMLFFETGIGLKPNQSISMQSYSCSSCHIPSRGFTAGRFQGVADGAEGFGRFGEGRSKRVSYTGDQVDAQGARPLPTINLAYVTNALWAGSFGATGVNSGTESVWHIDTLLEINFQGHEGLESNNQRALIVHRQLMNRVIADTLGYKAMFDAAFPDIPEAERYNIKTTAFAIAAYQRTIFTNQAPLQRWLAGDKSAMTEKQKKGALLFFGKAGCTNCHNSPSLNNMKFFALGVNSLYQSGFDVFRTGPNDNRNNGRGGFTQLPEDKYKFKVPQLYNLKDVGFYFHGASKRSLREVVDYFDAAVPENNNVPASQIASAFRPLHLTEEEKDLLVEFLTFGLFDPNLQRYAPEVTMSGNCFPDNDLESQIDLGCK